MAERPTRRGAVREERRDATNNATTRNKTTRNKKKRRENKKRREGSLLAHTGP
jgi:hypothetical protein